MGKNIHNLSIRLKIIILVLFFTASTIIVFYLTSRILIFKDYSLFENNIVEMNIKRIRFTFNDMFSHQNAKLSDWSVWDDLYDFSNNKNSQFVKTNLQSNTLVGLGVNFITIFNNKDDVIFNKIVDLDTQKELDNTSLTNLLKRNDKIQKHSSLDSHINGFINTPYGVAMISSAPIVHSDNTGPINGTIVFGNFINDNLVGKISEGVSYSVSVKKYYDDLPDDFIIAQKSLNTNSADYIQNIFTDQTISGYSLFYDLDNKPIFISKVLMNRDLYYQSLKVFKVYIFLISIIFSLFSIAIIVLFEKLIIFKFLKFNKDISEISKSKDLTKRIEIKEKDEIGNLADIINNMLNDLYTAKENDKKISELERISMESIKKHSEEIEKMNKLMIGRELKIIELKQQLQKCMDEFALKK